jgi:hypothetical protein
VAQPIRYAIASRWAVIDFILVFHWWFLFIPHRLWVIHEFYRSETRSKAISAARWRQRRHPTSPHHGITLILHSCAIHAQSLTRTVSKLLAFFACSVMANTRFRPLRGAAEQNWSYRSILRTQFCIGAPSKIFVYLLAFTSYSAIPLCHWIWLSFNLWGVFVNLTAKRPRAQIFLIAHCASREMRISSY